MGSYKIIYRDEDIYMETDLDDNKDEDIEDEGDEDYQICSAILEILLLLDRIPIKQNFRTVNSYNS